MLEALVNAIKQEKRSYGKEQIILSLFADDAIVYLENFKESTINLKLISKFSKVTEYKLNGKHNYIAAY